MKAVPAIALLILAAGPVAQAAGSALDWAHAFPVAEREASIHFTATYRDAANQPHRLEVWRYGSRFLHRRTDTRLDLYAAARDAAHVKVDYRLIDHQRKAVFDVNRGNLYQIGVFSDWPALAYVLDPPKTAYTLSTIEAPHGSHESGCQWRAIRSGQGSRKTISEVCWSAHWGIPLSILGADPAQPRFHVEHVESIESERPTPGLAPLPQGYAYFDSNEEIAPD